MWGQGKGGFSECGEGDIFRFEARASCKFGFFIFKYCFFFLFCKAERGIAILEVFQWLLVIWVREIWVITYIVWKLFYIKDEHYILFNTSCAAESPKGLMLLNTTIDCVWPEKFQGSGTRIRLIYTLRYDWDVKIWRKRQYLIYYLLFTKYTIYFNIWQVFSSNGWFHLHSCHPSQSKPFFTGPNQEKHAVLIKKGPSPNQKQYFSIKLKYVMNNYYSNGCVNFTQGFTNTGY